MSTSFHDLKKEAQENFLLDNFAEILYRQRTNQNMSQQKFLNEYFGYGKDLSLSQLKRYEKEYNTKNLQTRPKKNSQAVQNVLTKMADLVDKIYKEKIYETLFSEDVQLFGKNLQELGLLDCLEKAAGGLLGMNYWNTITGMENTPDELLERLFINAKRVLHNEPIAELDYEGRISRHDIFMK